MQVVNETANDLKFWHCYAFQPAELPSESLDLIGLKFDKKKMMN